MIKFVDYDSDDIDKYISWKKKGLPDDLPKSTFYKWKQRLEWFDVRENKLLVEGKEVIRPSNKIKVLQKEYTVPVGYEGFYDIIKEKYFNISIRDVRDFVRRQEYNQLHAPVQKKEFISSYIVSRPNFTWAIDLVDLSNYAQNNNNGFKWLLNAIDIFSKYAVSIPLKNKEAKTVVEGMKKVLEKFEGKPRNILSDNGSEFISKEFKDLMEEEGIKQVFTKPYAPQTNGAIERFNRTLKTLLFKLMTRDKSRNWLKHLEKVVDYYNEEMKHSSTGYTPQQVQENEDNNILVEKVRKRLKKKADDRELSSKNLPGGEIKVGDRVRVSILTDSEFKRNEKVLKRIGINWSKRIFEVYKIFNSRSKPWQKPFYQIKELGDEGEKYTRKYRRDELLLINDKILEKADIYIDKNDLEDGDIQEADKEEPVEVHLKKKKIPKPAEKSALEERKEENKPKRETKKPERFR